MIESLSKYISHFLYKNKIVDEDDLSIYQYGFEIIISTLLGFLITILIGIVLKMIFTSILYYIIFVFVRQLTGGYHANSYFKCNLIFAIISFMTLGITKLAVISEQYTFAFYLILLITSLLIIGLYSPVENEFKPLDAKQKKKNHIIGFIFGSLLSIISCILFHFTVKISILITLTLFMISMLIVIERIRKGGKEDEKY